MTTRSYVYFIWDRVRRAVKIGASTHPRRRLGGLQTAHAEPLILIGTFASTEGDAYWDEERAIHERFRKDRLSGEWFRSTVEIHDFAHRRRELLAVHELATLLGMSEDSIRQAARKGHPYFVRAHDAPYAELAFHLSDVQAYLDLFRPGAMAMATTQWGAQARRETYDFFTAIGMPDVAAVVLEEGPLA